MEFYVIGSINMDLIAHIAHFAVAGETILGDDLSVLPGGKGANQAVALSRLGNKVTMFGAVGNDEWGDTYKNIFANEGINTENIEIIENVSTGLALIELEKKGQNRIIVIPGANKYISRKYIDTILPIICSSPKKKTVLMQLEIPVDTVSYALGKLSEYSNIITILDPVPVPINGLSEEIYSNIDYIIPNEVEISTLTGIKISRKSSFENSLFEAGKAMLAKQCKNVIVKAGDLGAYYITSEKLMHFPLTARNTKVVDTTAAGDAFNAGFAHALQHNLSIDKAIAFANKVASISIAKPGAQSAMPTLEEVSKN